MRYHVRGENIVVTPALRDYAEKKISKLEKYFTESPNANVHVNLKVYPDKMKKVEVTIPLSELTLRAEEVNEDMYACIDLIADKLERQIRKHKTKINRKFRETGMKDIFVNDDRKEEKKDEEVEIVRVKRFDLKPMDAEEAVLQMNLLGHNFFVYTDAETNKTSIVYKRKDGKYGLIETV